jgi:glycosyltransferase involved in cell wall biosynthesis
MPFADPWSRLTGYYQRKVASLSYTRPFSIHPQRPLISFTFDDFPKSAFRNGGAILNRFGVAGTYYAALGLMDKSSPSGQIFSVDDLPLLFEQGHELGCHTFAHCNSWDTPAGVFEKSLVDNRSALHRLFPDHDFKTFAYPIQVPRPRVKAKTAEYFASCRGGGQRINVGQIDLNQLSAYFLEKSRDNIQAIKDVIELNRQACGWLIFATHEVTENPTPFGCTPEFFNNVVEYAVNSGAQIVPVVEALQILGVPVGGIRKFPQRLPQISVQATVQTSQPKPLVSILIPAYNSEDWIEDTLSSALEQTWEPKEIIVVDDGSRDQTLAIAKKFESDKVRVVSQKNQGAASARNTALSLCRGDYIQWLDADDYLASDKISLQMAVLSGIGSKRVLVSSEFGKFIHQWRRAEFVPSGLWDDLAPTEWLLRKMRDNLYMQTATWLVSRQLTEASGPWDTRMLSDDDGEYFCRVLLNSDGTRFVPGAKVYYRGFRSNSLAYVGKSNRKRDALWLSMKLHIGYLRSLEDTPRIREASLRYLQRNLINFYPERADIVEEAEKLAAELGGKLLPPHLSWKYSWIKSVFGWSAAKGTALEMRKIRWSLEESLDRLAFQVKGQEIPFTSTESVSPTSSGKNSKFL